MKRYYLDRLSLFQSIIKGIIINVLITIFLLVIMILAKILFQYIFIYLLLIIYIVVLIIQIAKAFEKKSFYMIDNTLVYCMKNNEVNIDLDNIKLIEEYYGINYLFGYKTIYLHLNNKKYPFVFKKERADKFKKQLEYKLIHGIEIDKFEL